MNNLCPNKLSRVGVGWVGGWVAGSIKNKAISASNEVEVEVEAELGNNLFFLEISSRFIFWIVTDRSLKHYND